jgi:hypothetical protein
MQEARLGHLASTLDGFPDARATGRRCQSWGDNMLRWLIRRCIGAWERSFDYDMSYLRDVLDAKIVATLAGGARVFPTVEYALGRGRACTGSA